MTSGNPVPNNNNDQHSPSSIKPQDDSPQSTQREGNNPLTDPNLIVSKEAEITSLKDAETTSLKDAETTSSKGEKRDWIELLIAPGLTALLGIIATIAWNIISTQQADQRYREGLVKDYVESVKGLLLDDYHSKDKEPEIKVEEVRFFVKSKTASTLKAISTDAEDPKQTNILTDFLRESSIGFIPIFRYGEKPELTASQSVCIKDIIKDTTNIKNITFYNFLCGIDLSKVKLNESNLQSIILEDANLHKAELKKAQLIAADLERANLTEAQLQEADLAKSNLREAYLMSANLEKANLKKANLRGADLRRKKLTDPHTDQEKILDPTNLSYATLVGANLIEAKLQDVDFTGANFQPVGFDRKGKKEAEIIPTNLRNANLEGANLSGADLRMANLRGANLKGAFFNLDTNFAEAIYDQYTCFPKYFKWSNPTSKKMLFILSDYKDDLKKQAEKNKEECIKNKKGETYQEKPELREADLRGADLRYADLRNVNLTNANLRGADLRGAILPAKLGDAKLDNALYDENTQVAKITLKELGMWKIGKDADLDGANLRGQDLTGVNLRGAKLQNADLSNVELDRWTELEGASYDQHTKLPFSPGEAKRRKMIYTPHLQLLDKNGKDEGEGQPVNWTGQNLQEGDFVQTNLSGAKLQETNLTKANFTKANLARAKLQRANLTEAKLQRANLTGADLRWADLTGADLRWADLIGVDLRWANLKDAKLGGVDLTKVLGIKLCKTIMPDGKKDDSHCKNPQKTNFSKANFINANLTEDDFTKANLTGADFTKANLTGADFTKANLTEANLIGADLTGANLTKANLKDAKLGEVDLTKVPGIKLCKTIMPDGKENNSSCQNSQEQVTGNKQQEN